MPVTSPEDLSNPGTELESPELAGGFFTAEPPEKPMCKIGFHKSIDLCRLLAERWKWGGSTK